MPDLFRVGLGLEPFTEVDLLGDERALGPPDAYGLGPQRHAVVGRGFRECPVQRGDGRRLARLLAELDGQLLRSSAIVKWPDREVA